MRYWTEEEGLAAAREHGVITEPKYFCIGLGKTGTTTFAECMRQLGLRHHGDGATTAYVQKDVREIVRLIRSHDSFDDYPWPYLYPFVRALCPNARFVLTKRTSVERWTASLAKHYAATGPTEAKRVFTGYRSPHQAMDRLAALYEAHLAGARAAFADGGSYTELCWEDGDGWPQLAATLDIPAPDTPLPHANARARSERHYAEMRDFADAKLQLMEGSVSASVSMLAASASKGAAQRHAAVLLRDTLKRLGATAALEALPSLGQPAAFSPKQRRLILRLDLETEPRDTGRDFIEDARSWFNAETGRPAVVFILDRFFLPGLYSAVASLLWTESLKGAEVIVISDSDTVLADPLVQAISPRAQRITDADFEAFQSVSRDSVMKGERHHRIAKYTLLKFLFFRDIAPGRAKIFMDCDMIALRKLDTIERAGETYDFLAAPALEHDGTLRGAVRTSVRAKLKPGSTRYNSGFMRVSPRFTAAHPDMEQALTRLAEGAEFSKEQDITSDYLRGQKGCGVLPASWNFLRSYARRMGPEGFEKVRKRLFVLHYVTTKPWERPASRMDFFDAPWRNLLSWSEARYGVSWTRAFANALSQTWRPR